MLDNRPEVDRNKKRVPITGYPNYEISDHGDIKNTKTGKALKRKWIHDLGLQVQLCKNGQSKNFYVHRLVAAHFVPNPYRFLEVVAKDGDKSNCHVGNLRFSNQQDERSKFHLVTSPDDTKQGVHKRIDAAIAASELQRDIDQLRVKLDRLERVLREGVSYA